MKFIFKGLVLILLNGCYYGINEKTSHIGDLNTNCLHTDAWIEIKKEYSTNTIDDTVFLEALKGFDNQPFSSEILYFKEDPEELIGVAEDHYSVRYVYNPKIRDQILDGLSPQLSEKEQKRIRNRVQKLLMGYQCEEGKKQALELMKEPVY